MYNVGDSIVLLDSKDGLVGSIVQVVGTNPRSYIVKWPGGATELLQEGLFKLA